MSACGLTAKSGAHPNRSACQGKPKVAGTGSNRRDRPKRDSRHCVRPVPQEAHQGRSFQFGRHAAETDRAPATGTPYYLPFVPSICVQVGDISRGYVVEIEWGNRGSAADDIEDLAGRRLCQLADRDFACSDASLRGIRDERHNAECKSSRCIQRHDKCDDGAGKLPRGVSGCGRRGESRFKTIGQ